MPLVTTTINNPVIKPNIKQLSMFVPRASGTWLCADSGHRGVLITPKQRHDRLRLADPFSAVVETIPDTQREAPVKHPRLPKEVNFAKISACHYPLCSRMALS